MRIACVTTSSAQKNVSLVRPALWLLFVAAVLGVARASHADDGDWPMPAHDYASTRYSPLAQITSANAGRLELAFSFSTSIDKGHEAAPIVVGSTMYVVTPFPNRVFALDLTRPGANVKWQFDPKTNAKAQGVACCDVVNRGAAYADGRLFFNTLDNHTIALDAASGKELWRADLGDIATGQSITMAPLVVKGKVLVGNSGGELGVRGWLTALDAATGKQLWRAYSTGPDTDVLIGAAFKPYYAQDRGVDLGVRTWPAEAWKIGGGTVWGWISYDPQLDLIYYGTGNPGPWNPEQRPGANKWTCGVFARHPENGEAVWFYQTSPHDLHDYDGVNESALVDLPIGGATRKVMLRADRNGYLYVMDRTTGEVLSADPFVHVTTSLGVDLATGALRYDATKSPKLGKIVREVCPASPGGKDWQPSAWSATVGWACAHQEPFALHAVHALFFTTAAAATFPAWQLWRATRSSGSGDETVARRHFLAGLATASSALSVLVIAAMWMPTWVISLCSN